MNSASRGDLTSIRATRYGSVEKSARWLFGFGTAGMVLGSVGLLVGLVALAALIGGSESEVAVATAGSVVGYSLLLLITGVGMIAFGQQLLTLVDIAVDVRTLVEAERGKNEPHPFLPDRE